MVDRRLNEIIENEKQLSPQKKLLLPNIKLIKRRIKAWRFWQEKTLELKMQRTKELASKTPWTNGGKDSLVLENIISRSLEDKIYRNEVEQYIHYQLGENVWEAILIRNSSIELLWKLKSSKDETLQIETFLKHLDLQPFKEFTCGEIPKKEYETHFLRSILIYNSQDTEVRVKRRSKKSQDFDVFIIPAKSFLNPETYLTINDDSYYELEKDGKCANVYDANKEDYIIL